MDCVIYQSDKNHMKPKFPAFIFNNHSNVSNWILESVEPELDLILWCKEFLNKDNIFIDIGSHVGTYSINLAPYCKKVYAFEAQRLTYYQLCGSIALNNLTNIYAHNCGISSYEDKGKTLDLNIISLDGGGSTFDLQSVVERNGTVLQTEKVLMNTIDDFNIESNIGLIKIDIESYELNAIKGMLNTLKRANNPPILFEVWSDDFNIARRQEIFDFLHNLGYKISAIHDYSFMFLASKN